MSALSFLLFLAVVAFWIRSDSVQEEWERSGGFQSYSIISAAGEFLYLHDDDSALLATPAGRYPDPIGPWHHETLDHPRHYLMGSGSWLNRNGFAVEMAEPDRIIRGGGWSGGGFSARLRRRTVIQFPDWAPAALFGVLPVIWLLALRRRLARRQKGLGHCARCGYDFGQARAAVRSVER